MNHTLPVLPYDISSLEPVISKKTFEFHYGKHHQTYVNNLNNLIPRTKFENMELEAIVKEADGGIFNNAAQIWNHTFYFTSFSPDGLREPKGNIAEAINKSFGSFADFKEKFSKAALTLFGSGWAWLVKDSNGNLSILQESNAGNPMTKGFIPILTCDVWEHAYYLDYQNKRQEYIDNFWKIIDWNIIGSRF
jgi:superoxide dismutase, Fe-Mn family